MNHSGVNSVKMIRMMRKYIPHGVTSESEVDQKIHSIGRYRKKLYLRATTLNLAFFCEVLNRVGASSSVTKPCSTPQRTQTCVRGPTP
jgi:hypothetical protein